MNIKDVPPEPDYTHFWITRDGTEIAYKDMTTTHLENTYNMLEKMMCSFQNKCHDIDDYYEPPEWVEVAMDAIAKELGRRELKYAQKMMED